MGAMASQITSLTIVYSNVYWSADQRKQLSAASLAFVRGIHGWPVNSPHKWPVTRKIFPFDDVIMIYLNTATDQTNPLALTWSLRSSRRPQPKSHGLPDSSWRKFGWFQCTIQILGMNDKTPLYLFCIEIAGQNNPARKWKIIRTVWINAHEANLCQNLIVWSHQFHILWQRA